MLGDTSGEGKVPIKLKLLIAALHVLGKKNLDAYLRFVLKLFLDWKHLYAKTLFIARMTVHRARC